MANRRIRRVTSAEVFNLREIIGSRLSQPAMEQPAPATTEPTAQRLVALDGLRGIAAIVVLMHHFEQTHGSHGVFSSGYLAVDFFFLLSGFVLVGPLEGQGTKPAGDGLRLFAMRVLRFWPLMALGAFLGALVHSLEWPLEQILPLFAFAVLSIPLAWRAGDAFALNGPQWSLFVELVWNVIHIALLRRLSSRVLLAMSLTFGVAVTLGHPWLNAATLGTDYDDELIGLLRAGFAYPLGVVIGRQQARWRAMPPIAGWIAPTLLVATIAAPAVIDTEGAFVDMIVRILFVAVLIAGVRSHLTENAARTMTWLGAISFPLYAVHGPIINLTDMAGRAAGGVAGSMIFLVGPAIAIVLAHKLKSGPLDRGLRLPAAWRGRAEPLRVATQRD